jgi:hypothetical protein
MGMEPDHALGSQSPYYRVVVLLPSRVIQAYPISEVPCRHFLIASDLQKAGEESRAINLSDISRAAFDIDTLTEFLHRLC